jgi:transcriptional regulator with XRE-family HTH domain
MNKLKIFLEKNNMSYTKFGLLINKSKAQVGMYARGLSIPTKEAMTKIMVVTGGFISPNDFFPPYVENKSEIPTNLYSNNNHREVLNE